MGNLMCLESLGGYSDVVTQMLRFSIICYWCEIISAPLVAGLTGAPILISNFKCPNALMN